MKFVENIMQLLYQFGFIRLLCVRNNIQFILEIRIKSIFLKVIGYIPNVNIILKYKLVTINRGAITDGQLLTIQSTILIAADRY